jgi:nucleoside-diphosphate-sugar epimerase
LKRLLIFGYGFTGRALVRRIGGWRIAATSRDRLTREALTAMGVAGCDPADSAALMHELRAADAVLVAAPPGEDGCPGLLAMASIWPEPGPAWVGYLSTTGVYGDRGGRWVREDTPPAPLSPEAHRRVHAEQAWSAFAAARGAASAIFRLPGIYGPGRSALDRVRAGEARRWISPGHVFSRIHVDDLAAALAAALERGATGVFNACDDEPAPAADVTLEACRLLGIAPPAPQPLDVQGLSPAAKRFWAESKRVSNARAKAALSWRPAYPSYREGLAAILDAEGRTG